MSKKKTKIIIPNHGFSEKYLTWQLGNCSQQYCPCIRSDSTVYYFCSIFTVFLIITLIWYTS